MVIEGYQEYDPIPPLRSSWVTLTLLRRLGSAPPKYKAIRINGFGWSHEQPTISALFPSYKEQRGGREVR